MPDAARTPSQAKLGTGLGHLARAFSRALAAACQATAGQTHRAWLTLAAAFSGYAAGPHVDPLIATDYPMPALADIVRATTERSDLASHCHDTALRRIDAASYELSRLREELQAVLTPSSATSLSAATARSAT